MDIYQTEEQQIQHIKNLWKKYGTSVLLGIAITVLVIFAWKYWQQRELVSGVDASIIYNDMIAGIVEKNPKLIQQQARQLVKKYQGSPYAKLAALMLAKQNIAAGKLLPAEQHLQWVIKHTHSQAIKQLAKIRLARIYLALKKPRQALDLLAKTNDASFLPLINATRGDSYVQLGEKTKARLAYDSALKHLPAAASIAPVVAMKRDNLQAFTCGECYAT